MAAPFATYTDVEAIWRIMTTEEQSRANAWASQASAMLRADFPGLDDRIDAGEIDAELVTGMVARAVRRVMDNPDGTRQTQTSFSIDDYSESETKTRDTKISAGELYFESRDLLRLRRRGTGNGKASSIRLGPGPYVLAPPVQTSRRWHGSPW